MTTVTLLNEKGTGTDNARLYEVTMGSYSIQTLVTASPSRAGSWLGTYTRNREDLVVGLDVEWRPNTQPNMQNPVATLQLCVDNHCLIFQILHAPSIPRSLTSFLANTDFIFVGVGIQNDVDKLLRDYNLRVSNFDDLCFLAAQELEIFGLHWAGLTTLARDVLDLDYHKPRHVTLSPWDTRFLTNDQVGYAAIDAFLSFQIGHFLIQ
ncbi:hypothetical protein VNO78_16639 [Psophocarpus tetragonolobus]|uniref:3'-5' exonuclease domain-containing protein n=1 Tax=Psophocarpus tetragonolobus TaxID=3891 RepID=A0AAN9XKW4_PSOTE